MTADPVLAAIRLTTQLNARLWTTDSTPPASPEVTAHLITGDDAAHHVVDAESRLGLDPLHANELGPALSAAALLEPTGWVLVLPRPGHLAALRGPVPTNTAALAAGAAVLSRTAGAAWVPTVVGAAIQWTIHPAAAPGGAPGPSDAERALSEAMVAATRELHELDVAGGARPDRPGGVRLPKAYGQRRQHSLDRGLLLHQACSAALEDDGSALSSFEMERRRAALTPLVGLSADVVAAACSTPPN